MKNQKYLRVSHTKVTDLKFLLAEAFAMNGRLENNLHTVAEILDIYINNVKNVLGLKSNLYNYRIGGHYSPPKSLCCINSTIRKVFVNTPLLSRPTQ